MACGAARVVLKCGIISSPAHVGMLSFHNMYLCTEATIRICRVYNIDCIIISCILLFFLKKKRKPSNNLALFFQLTTHTQKGLELKDVYINMHRVDSDV